MRAVTLTKNQNDLYVKYGVLIKNQFNETYQKQNLVFNDKFTITSKQICEKFKDDKEFEISLMQAHEEGRVL